MSETMAEWKQGLEKHQVRAAKARAEGLPALIRLAEHAAGGGQGGETDRSREVIGRFLLGLYSRGFPFDLSSFHALNEQNFSDVIVALNFERCGRQKEIHEHIQAADPDLWATIKKRWVPAPAAQEQRPPSHGGPTP